MIDRVSQGRDWFDKIKMANSKSQHLIPNNILEIRAALFYYIFNTVYPATVSHTLYSELVHSKTGVKRTSFVNPFVHCKVLLGKEVEKASIL